MICNGTSAGTLTRAAAGEAVGTRFAPQERTARASSSGSSTRSRRRGRVLVDAGAARVLREQGSSLLPVGVVEVEGDFEAGDAVEVRRRRRRADVGKGISNYSAAELAAGERDEERRRCGSCCRTRARKPCTATISCSSSGRALASYPLADGRRTANRSPRAAPPQSARARRLAALDTATKNAALEAIAAELEARADEILEANAGRPRR